MITYINKTDFLKHFGLIATSILVNYEIGLKMLHKNVNLIKLNKSINTRNRSKLEKKLNEFMN